MESEFELANEEFSEGFASDQSSRSLRRDDSRIEADAGWHLKAPMDHKVNGNFGQATRDVHNHSRFMESSNWQTCSQAENSIRV